MRQARLEATKDKRAKLAQYFRERREILIKSGLCPRCGKNPAMPGIRECESCTIKRKEKRNIPTHEQKAKHAAYVRLYKEAMKRNGICIRCGKNNAIKGLSMCADCREKYNAARREKRKSISDVQKAKIAESKKRSYQKSKELGLCVWCKTKKALNGLVLCNDCRLYCNQSRSGYVEHSMKWIEKERRAGRL